jgi:hypothetical protein
VEEKHKSAQQKTKNNTQKAISNYLKTEAKQQKRQKAPIEIG